MRNLSFSIFYICSILLASCQSETPIPQKPETLTPLPISQSLLERKSSVTRELLPTTPVCIENNICWGNQLPDGGKYSLAGTSPLDVWTLSTNGQGLFHFDGTKWSLVPHSFGIQGKVWTQTPNQIWIVDAYSRTTANPNGAFLQCQPTGCQQLSALPIDAIFISDWNILGTAPNKFWFYGVRPYPEATVYHFDGTKPAHMQWTSVDFHQMAQTDLSINTFFSGQLWGSSDTDIWAVLFNTHPTDKDFLSMTLVHYNGTKLDKKIDLSDPLPLDASWDSRIAGTSASNIWFTYPKRMTTTEKESVFYYFNGTNWEKKESTFFPFSLTTKGKSGFNMYFPAPFYFQTSGEQIFMQVTSEDAGYNHIWLWENQRWYQIKTGVNNFLFATDRNNHWWMDKNNEIQTTHPKFSSPITLYLDNLLHEGKDTLWFYSRRNFSTDPNDLVIYKKGEAFRRYKLPENTWISALWSQPNHPDELWMATQDGQLQHIKDINYLSMQTSYNINLLNDRYNIYVTALWGSQTHGLWAIVSDSRILRFQDPDWIVDNQQVKTNLYVLHGTGTNTLWAGGKNALIRGNIQNTDVTWTEVNLPMLTSENYEIEKIWDVGENDVWFSVNVWDKNKNDYEGKLKLLHFDGQAISLVQVPFQKAYDFSGDSKGNIWATVEIAPYVIGLWQRVNGSWVQRTSGGLSANDLQVTENFGLFQFNDGNWLWKPIQ